MECYHENFVKKDREKGVKLGAIFKSEGFNAGLRAYQASDDYLQFAPLKHVAEKRFQWLPEPGKSITLSDADAQYLEELSKKVVRCANFVSSCEDAIDQGQNLHPLVISRINTSAKHASNEIVLLGLQLVAGMTQLRRDGILEKARELKPEQKFKLRHAPFAEEKQLFPDSILEQIHEAWRKDKEVENMTAKATSSERRKSESHHQPHRRR